MPGSVSLLCLTQFIVDIIPRERRLSSRAALEELGEDDYETEIQKCTGVTGYHRWFFLKALSESLGFQLRVFAVEKGGATVGVVPVVLMRRGPLLTSNYLPILHVGPLMRDAAYLDDVLAAAERYRRRHLVVAMRWAFAPGATIQTEPLTRRGFQVETLQNFFVPADRSPGEHLAAITGRRRRDIKVWQDRGATAGPADPEEVKDWFVGEVGHAYRRQGADWGYSPDACRLLVDHLGTDPRMLWRSVHDEHGRLIAVTANIIGADRLYGWLLAGAHDIRPSPHILAYWDAIEWSLSRGLACDMSAAPTAGIRRFKLEFGAESESWLVADRGLEKYFKARELFSRMARRQNRQKSTQHQAEQVDVDGLSRTYVR